MSVNNRMENERAIIGHRQLFVLLFFCAIVKPNSVQTTEHQHTWEENAILRPSSIISAENNQYNVYVTNYDEDVEDLPLPPIDGDIDLDSASLGEPLTLQKSETIRDPQSLRITSTSTVSPITIPGVSVLSFLVGAITRSLNLISTSVASAIAPLNPFTFSSRTSTENRQGQTLEHLHLNSTLQSQYGNTLSTLSLSSTIHNFRCRPACPTRTLLVVYKYPRDIIQNPSIMKEFPVFHKTLKNPPKSTSTTGSVSSSPVGPIQGIGRFVLGLLKEAKKMNLLEFRNALSNTETTNTATSIEESLNGLGISPDELNRNEYHHPLEDDIMTELSLKDTEHLQRGFVILRLMKSVGDKTETDGKVSYMTKSLSAIEADVRRLQAASLDTTSISSIKTTSATTITTTTDLTNEVFSTFDAIADPSTESYTEKIRLTRATPSTTTTTITSTTRSTFTVKPSVSTTTTLTFTSTRSGTTTTTDTVSTSYQPPFYTTYLSNLHMESIEVPTEAYLPLFKQLLMEDPNVAAVYEDVVVDFEDTQDETTDHIQAGMLIQDNEVVQEGTNLIQGIPDEQQPSSIKVPSDKFFYRQWGLTSPSDSNGGANVIDAWAMWNGMGKPRVTIALLDSGIDLNHRDLQNQMWINPDEICDNGIDDDKNGYIDDCRGWVCYGI